MMMLSGGNTSSVGVGPQPAAANPLREKVRMEVGITGIANIPNQVHYLASHTQVDFNILLMGTFDELFSFLVYIIKLLPLSPLS